MSGVERAETAEDGEGEREDLRPIGLLSRHFLIDSSVFIKFHVQMRGRLWENLREAVEEFGLRLHTNDLVKFEVGRWLGDQADILAREYRTLVRNAECWNRRLLGGVAVPEQPDPIQLAATARVEFARALIWLHAVEHEVEDADISLVLNKYKRNLPPFHKPGSKEFPDALILESVRGWAVHQGQQIYVVSEDNAMLADAEATDGLIPVRGLAAFLEIVAEARDPSVAGLVNEIADEQDFNDALVEKLEAALSTASYRYLGHDFQDGYVDYAQITGVDSTHHWAVVSLAGDVVTFVFNITFTAKIDAVLIRVERDEDGQRGDEHPTLKTYDQSFRSRLYVKFDMRERVVINLEILQDLNFDDPIRFRW